MKNALSITVISERGMGWYMSINNEKVRIWMENTLTTFMTVWY